MKQYHPFPHSAFNILTLVFKKKNAYRVLTKFCHDLKSEKLFRLLARLTLLPLGHQLSHFSVTTHCPPLSLSHHSFSPLFLIIIYSKDVYELLTLGQKLLQWLSC